MLRRQLTPIPHVSECVSVAALGGVLALAANSSIAAPVVALRHVVRDHQLESSLMSAVRLQRVRRQRPAAPSTRLQDNLSGESLASYEANILC